MWVKAILKAIYNLDILRNIRGGEPDLVKAYVDAGEFRDHSIIHGHFPPQEGFFEALKSAPSSIVTPLRNPYDTFVSLYFFVNNHPKAVQSPDDPVTMMVGKPIDHVDVLDYLAASGGYETHLALSLAWIQSGQAVLTRYEHLMADPFREVTRITNAIRPAHHDVIRQAIMQSSAEETRKKGDYWRIHVRSGKVGDWRKYLTPKHLDILRTNFGEMIDATGYMVW